VFVCVGGKRGRGVIINHGFGFFVCFFFLHGSVAWPVVDLVKLVHVSLQRGIGVIRLEADRAPHSLSH